MRTIIILLSILLNAACTRNEFSSQQEQNQALIERYFKHFNNHNWQKMAELYVEKAEFKDPSLGNGIVKMTRAEIQAKYSELNQVFPDIHDKVIKTYPSGDKNITVEFVSSGTAPDGSSFKLPICTIFTIENGKITQDFSYFDNFD